MTMLNCCTKSELKIHENLKEGIKQSDWQKEFWGQTEEPGF